MGLFSSKKKTTVHTSVMRLVENDRIPETSKSSMLKAILGDGSVSEYLLDGLMNSAAFRTERMYNYAKKSYTHGLPHGSIITDTQGKGVVQQVLSQELGQTVTLDYFKFAPISSIHVAWQKLVEQYGYFAGTNELTSLSAQEGTPVYLQDMVAIYREDTVAEAEPGTLDQFGLPATAGYTPERTAQVEFGLAQYLGATDFVLDGEATVDYVEVSYVYWLAGVKQTGKLTISLAGYDYEGDYFQVQYRVPSNPGKAMFWTYLNESGVYPEIDRVYLTNYSELGSYFPFAYFRFNKQNLGADNLKNTAAYKSTTKMLKYLSMDFQELCDSVHENPDIDDIEQAFLMLGVPAKADSQVEKRYLFEYFNTLYLSDVSPILSIPDMEKGLTAYSYKEGRSILIKDRKFKMTLGYTGIVKRKVAGKIGKVGEFFSGTGSMTVPGPLPLTANYHWYRRQTNSVFYEEIRVVKPHMTYHIYGKYTFTGGTGSDELLIPIDRAVTDLIPTTQREDLYLRSLHFVFNSVIVTKTKWYQTGLFKTIVVILAVVISIYTGGAGSFLTALATAAAAGISTLAITVVTMILKSMVASYLFSLIAKEMGAEFAMVLAIGAAIYGGMAANSAGSVAASTTAQNMLRATTGLVKAAADEYSRGLAEKYDSALSEFNLLQDTLTKELDEAKKLLQTATIIDPFEFIGDIPRLSLGESPDNFYRRTVHSGNIGVVGFHAISSYVDMSLKLPELNDTIGDSLYV